MIWYELDHRVKAKQLTEVNTSENSSKTWKTLPDNYLMKLIESMPKVREADMKVATYFE